MGLKWSEISAVTLVCIGGLCLLAAITNAHFDQFGIKFQFKNVAQRLGAVIVGLLFIVASWAFHKAEAASSACNVSGTATSSGR